MAGGVYLFTYVYAYIHIYVYNKAILENSLFINIKHWYPNMTGLTKVLDKRRARILCRSRSQTLPARMRGQLGRDEVEKNGRGRVWQTPEAPQTRGCLVAFNTRPHLYPTFRLCVYLGGWRQLWKVGCGRAAPSGWVGWGSAAGAQPNFSPTSQEGQDRRLSPYLITDRSTPRWGLLAGVSLLLLGFFLGRCPARKRKPRRLESDSSPSLKLCFPTSPDPRSISPANQAQSQPQTHGNAPQANGHQSSEGGQQQ